MAFEPRQQALLASVRDRDTMRRMRQQDPDGLRQLLQDYAARVQWSLRREFRTLSETDVDEALNAAALSAWRAAAAFDERKGTVRAWFYVIARHAALGIVRRELRQQKNVEVMSPNLAGLEAPSRRRVSAGAASSQFIAALRRCVERLPRLQRSIIEADLEAPDEVAAAAELALRFSTSKNAVYVSRSAARKALKRCLLSSGHGLPQETAVEQAEELCDEI